MKMTKFGTKNALFGYFWTRIWKQFCHIWKLHPRICLIAKFRGKTKMPKFGIKNALFEYFWARIFKNYCHIWNQHPKICLIASLGLWAGIWKNSCHIWNQHPGNRLVAKFGAKIRIHKFGSKFALFGYFWAGVWK